VESVRNVRTKNGGCVIMRDTICVIRKFIQKLRYWEVPKQNPLVLLVKIIGRHQKPLGNGKGVQIFQNSMGNLKILGDR
jgi:hypothetical protein